MVGVQIGTTMSKSIGPKTRAFLKALQALCRKHDATIDACGCCSSAFVTVADETGTGHVSVIKGKAFLGPPGKAKDIKLAQPTVVIDGEECT